MRDSNMFWKQILPCHSDYFALPGTSLGLPEMDQKIFVLILLPDFLIARQEFITMHCSLDSNIVKELLTTDLPILSDSFLKHRTK